MIYHNAKAIKENIMTVFAITRDNSGAVAYGLEFCDNNQYIELVATVEDTLTVPSNTNFDKFQVVFGYTPGSTVWVGTGSSPISLPAAGTFGATVAQLNPTVRIVDKGTTLRFITADANVGVGVSFYGIA